MNSKFNEGIEAFEQGLNRGQNPYMIFTPDGMNWDDGFDLAYQDSQLVNFHNEQVENQRGDLQPYSEE